MRRRRPRTAFTLVELLVVIGIIAALISILLPTLSKARENAYRVQCQSNERQILTAIMIYANQWKGSLPYSNWGANPTTSATYWPVPDGAGGTVAGPGWLYQEPNKSQQKHVEGGVLWQTLRTYNVYHCPKDQGPFIQSEPVHALSSYGMNGAVNGYGALKGAVSYKITKFKPDRVLLWEMDETTKSSGWNDGANRPDEGLTKRHGKASHVGCFDGHVERMRDDEYQRLVNLAPGVLWCNPSTVNGK